MGVIYKVTSPSNKIYIGKTVAPNFSNRKACHEWDAHNPNNKNYHSKFSRAIRKYGIDLQWELLEEGLEEPALSARETELIAYYNSYKKGYNSTLGGEGVPGRQISDETRKKMSDSHLGINNTPAQNLKISVNNGRYWAGKRRDPETLKKAWMTRKIRRLGKASDTTRQSRRY